MPELSELVSISNCDSCSMCLPSQICIPNCSFSSFLNTTIQECKNCTADCTTGCRNQENCTLCIDPYCASCSSYLLDSCVECDSGYEVYNYSCILCNSTSYYSSIDKICEICPERCASCISSTGCLQCENNNHINSSNLCECNLGYAVNDSICERQSFYAFITIDDNNIASIRFDEELMDDMQSRDIQVLYNGIQQEFTLQKLENSLYSVSVSFTSNINPGDRLEVKFANELVSKVNKLLATTDLLINLFPTSNNELASQIAQAQSYAKVGLAAGLGVAFGSSCINLNPASFFNLLNNLDIYMYTSLFQQNLDDSLLAFLQSLNYNSMIPNIFTYLISENDGNQLDQRYNNLGNNTNLILLNSGLNICAVCSALSFTANSLCFQKY